MAMIRFTTPKDVRLADRDAVILQYCRNKKVLHLGCTDSPDHVATFERNELLHRKVAGVASSAVGVDIDAPAIEWLGKKTDVGSLFVGDIENWDFMQSFQDQDFDVILLADVVEHLNNAGLALSNVRRLCKDDTIVIVSVPNAFAAKTFLRMIFGREMVNRDHVAYYSFYTLQNLISRCGFKPALRFSYLGRGTGIAARLTNGILSLLPWLAEGIAIVSLPEGGAGRVASRG